MLLLSYIADIDDKIGAPLKLKILNEEGKDLFNGCWLLYSNTFDALVGATELDNYGAPTEQKTCEYAKVILSLMSR